MPRAMPDFAEHDVPKTRVVQGARRWLAVRAIAPRYCCEHISSARRSDRAGIVSATCISGRDSSWTSECGARRRCRWLRMLSDVIGNGRRSRPLHALADASSPAMMSNECGPPAGCGSMQIRQCPVASAVDFHEEDPARVRVMLSPAVAVPCRHADRGSRCSTIDVAN